MHCPTPFSAQSSHSLRPRSLESGAVDSVALGEGSFVCCDLQHFFATEPNTKYQVYCVRYQVPKLCSEESYDTTSR